MLSNRQADNPYSYVDNRKPFPGSTPFWAKRSKKAERSLNAGSETNKMDRV